MTTLIINRTVKTGGRQSPEKATPLLAVDLDGTVRHGKTELGRFVHTPGDVTVFPEAAEQIRRWKDRGGRVIAVSNQGGIALGYTTNDQCRATMARTHELCDGIFDKICYCPHFPTATDPEMARCWCRKPSPGLLIEGAIEIAEKYNEYYPPHMGLFVGDRPEDEECARLAGFPFMWAVDWRAQAGVREGDGG